MLAAATLIPWPLVNMGINDDWSYILTTRTLAHTGHFGYNGWAAPILGWQALWGAMFARLFGASFNVIRLSLIPINLSVPLLYYAILRRCGLNSRHAVFGTLALVLSPVFVPLADTFMTDVTSLFAILVCVYLCQRALAAETDRSALLWLAVAAVSNILLGSVRQVVWLGILVMIPSCGWLLRRRRYAVSLTVALWLVGVVSIQLFLAWFLRHPYSVPEKLYQGRIGHHEIHLLLRATWRSCATLLLLCLPVLAAGLVVYRRSTKLYLPRIAAAASILLVIVLYLARRNFLMRLEPPWLGNIINIGGIFEGPLLFGPLRQIPESVRLLTLFAVIVCTAAFVEALLTYRRAEPAPVPAPNGRDLSWHSLSILLLPFTAAYCILLVPRAVYVVLFDRYFIMVMAVLIIFMLRWHQERMSPRLPLLSYITLAVLALAGVAGTHDLFAMDRARLQLANELQRAGIPRTAVNGGFEYDTVSQVQAWGYVNDFHIVNPPGSFKPQPLHTGPCAYPYSYLMPAVKPEYVLAADASPCYTPTQFPTASYHTWLPPGEHQLFIGKMLPGSEDPLPTGR